MELADKYFDVLIDFTLKTLVVTTIAGVILAVGCIASLIKDWISNDKANS